MNAQELSRELSELASRWPVSGKEFLQAKRDLAEARYLLRQIFYARSAVGTKFEEELEAWKLEDLRERIFRAIHGQCL